MREIERYYIFVFENARGPKNRMSLQRVEARKVKERFSLRASRRKESIPANPCLTFDFRTVKE